MTYFLTPAAPAPTCSRSPTHTFTHTPAALPFSSAPAVLFRHGALLSHYGAAAAEAKDGEEAAELEAAVQRAQVGAECV